MCPRPADPNAKIDLLRAAEQVFIERGLDLGKVEDIAERAGRSKGAFYLHFGSKEDAFKQIVESLIARLEDCLDESRALLSGPPPTANDYLRVWHEIDVEVLEFVWQNRGVVRLVLEGGKSAQFAHLIDEFAERSRSHTRRLIEWASSIGFYRADVDAQVASLAIAGAYDRVARDLVRRERKPDLDALSTELQRFVLAGVAAAPLRSIIDRRSRNAPSRSPKR